jgi:glutamate/tyrosine decarboxylase-like PLP-dependent enzyme
MRPAEFRELGRSLVDQIADFLESLPSRPVTRGEAPSQVRALLGGRTLPRAGSDPAALLREAATLLFEHSLFNGHPRFLGYITSSAAPIGALGDMLAASVNPNLGAWVLSPIATEIERQTVSWISELIGYAPDSGGLLVSGGNMANIVGFLAARRAKAGWDVRKAGVAAREGKPLRLYTSAETHTWVEKAADLSGLGTDSIRWIPTDPDHRMDVAALRREIERDLRNGDRPFLVIGTAGSVSTGAIDPLEALHEVSRAHDLWFHVDGAYGALAASLPELEPEFAGMAAADSVAVDPHKWLYAPLEAGCALVRDPAALRDAFSYTPPYYRAGEVAGEEVLEYRDYGPQNSRGFRALKVWLGLRQAGREGCVRSIQEDIALAERLLLGVRAHPELEAVGRKLSVTTFRFAPRELRGGTEAAEDYLNRLNAEIVARLQDGGEVFVSQAVVAGATCLRSCVVNFRTSAADIDAIPEIVARAGRRARSALAPERLQDQ